MSTIEANDKLPDQLILMPFRVDSFLAIQHNEEMQLSCKTMSKFLSSVITSQSFNYILPRSVFRLLLSPHRIAFVSSEHSALLRAAQQIFDFMVELILISSLSVLSRTRDKKKPNVQLIYPSASSSVFMFRTISVYAAVSCSRCREIKTKAKKFIRFCTTDVLLIDK